MMNDKVALVTGASSGIGVNIALSAAANGAATPATFRPFAEILRQIARLLSGDDRADF